MLDILLSNHLIQFPICHITNAGVKLSNFFFKRQNVVEFLFVSFWPFSPNFPSNMTARKGKRSTKWNDSSLFTNAKLYHHACLHGNGLGIDSASKRGKTSLLILGLLFWSKKLQHRPTSCHFWPFMVLTTITNYANIWYSRNKSLEMSFL